MRDDEIDDANELGGMLDSGLLEVKPFPIYKPEAPEKQLRSLEYDPYGMAFPFTLNLRIKYFLTGVIFPATNIVAAMGSDSPSTSSPWQSGRMVDYQLVFMSGVPLAYFLPVFLFSMAGLIAVVFQPSTRKLPWVRVALMGGAIASVVHLLCLLPLTGLVVPLIAAVFVGPCLAFLIWTVMQIPWSYVRKFGIRHIVILTSVVACLLGLFQFTELSSVVFSVVFGSLVACFVSASALNATTYLRLAIAVEIENLFEVNEQSQIDNRWLRHEDSPPWPISLVSMAGAWLVAYGSSWILAVRQTLVDYEKLPTSDPNCYVSSAAAHGHATLVGSFEVAHDGSPVVVNRQMQEMKCLELAFAVTLPKAHRLVRRVYNFVGPKLAWVCRRNAWFADVSFLMLKPVEWMAVCVRRIARIDEDLVGEIYRT